MKLDTRAFRYLTSEDWRVLIAVCIAAQAFINIYKCDHY